jgi:hypothetical protein
MQLETALDAAFLAMEADLEAEAPRLRFHEALLATELFVLLEEEAGERLKPRHFDLEEGRFVLAFDTDARLAAFLDEPAPYAALSGRRLAAALAGEGVGIALNPGVAPAQTLLPAEAVDWLAAMSATGERAEARLREVGPPRGAPDALLAALKARVDLMAGAIAAAWLAQARLTDGTERLTLAVTGAGPEAEPEVAESFAEAARFAQTTLDLAFLPAEAPALGAFVRFGIRFDPPPLPVPDPPAAPKAPGRDPARPPRLR